MVEGLAALLNARFREAFIEAGVKLDKLPEAFKLQNVGKEASRVLVGSWDYYLRTRLKHALKKPLTDDQIDAFLEWRRARESPLEEPTTSPGGTKRPLLAIVGDAMAGVVKRLRP